jgi:iron complex outermembrane receptor protein
VAAAYVEIETSPNNRLAVNIGTRYEYYSDFGGNIGAKLAAVYNLFNKFSVRASVNNGFRAPSLQQRYVMAVQATNINTGGALTPGYRGIFSNDHTVANAFGIPILTAERTVNVSSGFTASFLKKITLAIDAYWIQIKDRIILSGTLSTDNPDVKKILDSIPGIRIDQVQFFSNAINTRTRGLDIVLNGNWNNPKRILSITFAANFTKTYLFGDIKATDKLPVNTINSNSLFNLEEQTRMRHGQPANKIIATLFAKKGKAAFRWSSTRYGSTKTATLTNASSYTFAHEFFSSKIISDVSVNYDPKKWLTITLGSNNLFDVYPDPIKSYENTLQGILIYSPEASPFAFNGGYYYVGMSFNFLSSRKSIY